MRIAAWCGIVVAVAIIILAWTTYVPAAAQAVVDAVPVVVAEEPQTWLDWVLQIANVVLVTFGAAAAAAVTGLVFKLFPGIAQALGDQRRGRLNEIIVNGMFWALDQVKQGLARKDQVPKLTVDYAARVGASVIKALGDDPAAQSTRDKLAARAEKMIADPAVTTPPELTPPGGKADINAVISPAATGG